MASDHAGMGRTQSWVEKLTDFCRESQYPQPVFNIISDRRGGRTAWSSTVIVPTPASPNQQTIQARYWYDGQHVSQAKEDAAEVALRMLQSNRPDKFGGERGFSQASPQIPTRW